MAGGGPRRCLLGCPSTQTTLFRLPSDAGVRAGWLEFLHFDESGLSVRSRVCGRLFTQSCFLNYGQYSAGLAKDLILTDTAVPIVYTVGEPSSKVLVCKPEPVHSMEEERQEMISHDVAENCFLTCIRWLEQQPDASPKHLDALRELHVLAKIKKGSSSSVSVGSGPEFAVGNTTRSSHPQQGLDGVLDARRVAAQLHSAGGHDNMEAADGAKRPFVTFPHPDHIRTVTVSEEHIKTEQDWEPTHVELKCEPTDISISQHKSSYVFTGR